MICEFCVLQIFQKNPLKEYYPPPLDVRPCGNGTDVAWTYNGTEADLRSNSILDSLAEFSTSFPYHNFTSEPNFNSSCDEQDGYPYEHPNTAFLSMILTFGTFLIAHYLKNFRNSQFLGRSVRLKNFCWCA